MKPLFPTIALVLFGLRAAAEAPPGFDSFKETRAEYDARAQWLRDAKFGVFIHWNPSSLIGKEISWSRDAYGRKKYDQLYKQFRAEHFNADQWVKLFQESGIRYAVIVPKHHDGFCMFETKTSDYNVMHAPFGRDYVKEMSDACRRGGVKFCLYYSIVDWWNPKYSGKAGADLTEYKKIMRTHLTELLSRYGPVGYLWFDGNWELSWTQADAREFYALCRKLQPNVLVNQHLAPRTRIFPNAMGSPDASNYVGAEKGTVPICAKHPSGRSGKWGLSPFPLQRPFDIQTCEMGIMQLNNLDLAWDMCNPLSPTYSWGPSPRKPASWAIHSILQCAGRGGSFLLGIGPRADGTIDPADEAVLRNVGTWLKRNGQSLDGTRGGPWAADGRCVSTRKDDKVYLFVTQWHADGLGLPAASPSYPGDLSACIRVAGKRGDSLLMTPLPAQVKAARVLTGGTVNIETGQDLWRLRVPEKCHDPMVTIVELTLDRSAMSLPEIPALPRPVSEGKPVEVSSVWPGRSERDLKKSYITDGRRETTWAAAEKARTAWVTVDLQSECEISEAMLSDAPYGRTRAFDLEAQVAGQWQRLAAGTTIGRELHLEFAPVKARLFRLNIRKASDTPTLAEFQLFE